MRDLINRVINKYQSLTVEETLYLGIVLLVVIIGVTLFIQSLSRKKKNVNSLEDNMKILEDLMSNTTDDAENEEK